MQSELATLHNECKALERSLYAMQQVEKAIQLDLHDDDIDEDDLDFSGDSSLDDIGEETSSFWYEYENLRSSPSGSDLYSVW